MSTSHRTFVSYIDKSREFYAAHGYEKPYRWATVDDVPFAPLRGPLKDLRVGVVTTSFPLQWSGRKVATAVAAEPTPEAMFTADLSWDKDATHTDDVGSFLPLDVLKEAKAAGRIGSLSPRLYCVPTEYSQRKTRIDAEHIRQACEADEVDVVLLVPL